MYDCLCCLWVGIRVAGLVIKVLLFCLLLFCRVGLLILRFACCRLIWLWWLKLIVWLGWVFDLVVCSLCLDLDWNLSVWVSWRVFWFVDLCFIVCCYGFIIVSGGFFIWWFSAVWRFSVFVCLLVVVVCKILGVCWFDALIRVVSLCWSGLDFVWFWCFTCIFLGFEFVILWFCDLFLLCGCFCLVIDSGVWF